MVRRAGRLLRSGGLVAFPTETVYGLGANALDAAAAARIFAAKGRPADNPLIVHVADGEEAAALSLAWPAAAVRLVRAFWPGPLTLVVPASPVVPAVVRAGLPTVAVRCPAHPVARALLRAARVPVAAPSANRSGRPSPTTARAVAEDLDGRVDLVVDGGSAGIGVESTVVDVSVSPAVLLRPGGLPREDIEAVVGPLVEPTPGGPARSPGMKYRHYAPDRPVVWLRRSPAEAAAVVRARCDPAATGVLAPTAVLAALPEYVHAVDLGPSAETAAQRLFEGLRRLDRIPAVRVIVAVWDSDRGLGLAIGNRLAKAAGEVWT
ncbi:MAG: threonylcarbamoyl-AMP synthase [Actinomycetia bacterium]|nr:threonylcarbamoyl-AMP synthase [Actinomycetes bacterium]